MTLCPQCQSVNQPNSAFCANCGIAFSVAPLQNKSNLQTVLIILGSLFGACLLCGLLGAIQEQINPPKKTETISNSKPDSNIRTLISTPTPSKSSEKSNSNVKQNSSVSNSNTRTNSNTMQNSAVESKALVEEKPKEKPKEKQEKSSYYIRGPRGGCYYLSPSGRKQYVDRSLCD